MKTTQSSSLNTFDMATKVNTVELEKYVYLFLKFKNYNISYIKIYRLKIYLTLSLIYT